MAKLPVGTATVNTEGRTTITLMHLAPGTVVRDPNGTIHVRSTRTVTVVLAAGTSTIAWSSASRHLTRRTGH